MDLQPQIRFHQVMVSGVGGARGPPAPEAAMVASKEGYARALETPSVWVVTSMRWPVTRKSVHQVRVL